ncbi:unnamed protein product [Staurois parvus]|uniref:Uncharacterized protein n=1 Tax=Staurois parvus TaxID=386267 RepID=A0ABN9G249_9NEOB|nr:unnamed protein product [Staurois parvus]
MGPLCPCPNSKKPMKKATRGISWGPLLTPGPRAVPKFPNGQSAPVLGGLLAVEKTVKSQKQPLNIQHSQKF